MEKIYFQFEEISSNKTLEIRDNVLQVGFLNYSTNTVFINQFPLSPVPDPNKFQIASNMLWLPIGKGEIDVTQYKISFKNFAAEDINQLFVWYKMTNLNK